MKLTSAQKVRLAVFMAAGAGVLAVTVITIAGLTVFQDRDKYVVHFTEDVTGLEASSPVRYQGLRVGRAISAA